MLASLALSFFNEKLFATWGLVAAICVVAGIHYALTHGKTSK